MCDTMWYLQELKAARQHLEALCATTDDDSEYEDAADRLEELDDQIRNLQDADCIMHEVA